MTKKKDFDLSTQGLGNLGRFVQFLIYTAKPVGESVIRIDEKHTIKKCCYCGKSHDMSSWNHVMICDLCYVSYHKVPSGRAINNLLIIFNNKEFPMYLKFEDG